MEEEKSSAIPIGIPRLTALQVQCNVWKALFLREFKNRVGNYRFAYLWVFVEPLVTVIVLGFVLAPILQRTVPSMPYSVFLLTGFIPFRLFDGIVTRNLSSLQSNEGLLIYPQVFPLDTLLVRAFLESLLFVVIFTTAVLIMAWVGLIDSPGDLLQVVFAFGALILIATGLSIFLALVALKVRDVEKMIAVPRRILFFCSCVIYPFHAIPPEYQAWGLWNPLLVVIESIRQGLFPGYSTAEMPLGYPPCVGVVLLWLGMAYHSFHRGSLHQARST